MYYALTVKDNIITGVHESEKPITDKTFKANPWLAEDLVIPIDTPMDYLTGTDIRCFEKDGKLKDPVWCIEQGYMKLPPDMELIDGELIKKDIPVEEAPPSLKDRLMAAEQKVLEMAEVVAKLTTDVTALKGVKG